jgi:hypothetical protein
VVAAALAAAGCIVYNVGRGTYDLALLPKRALAKRAKKRRRILEQRRRAEQNQAAGTTCDHYFPVSGSGICMFCSAPRLSTLPSIDGDVPQQETVRSARRFNGCTHAYERSAGSFRPRMCTICAYKPTLGDLEHAENLEDMVLEDFDFDPQHMRNVSTLESTFGGSEFLNDSHTRPIRPHRPSDASYDSIDWSGWSDSDSEDDVLPSEPSSGSEFEGLQTKPFEDDGLPSTGSELAGLQTGSPEFVVLPPSKSRIGVRRQLSAISFPVEILAAATAATTRRMHCPQSRWSSPTSPRLGVDPPALQMTLSFHDASAVLERKLGSIFNARRSLDVRFNGPNQDGSTNDITLCTAVSADDRMLRWTGCAFSGCDCAAPLSIARTSSGSKPVLLSLL